MLSASETVDAGYEAIDSIKLAIKEIYPDSNYDEVVTQLEDVISEIKNIIKDNEEEAKKEQQLESDYQNMEYERSVI